jgi:outer membrane protein
MTLHRLVASGLALSALAFAQNPMHLSLADAERLAVTSNPRFQVSRLDAAAQHQVTEEQRSNFRPNVVGSFTSVGADSGSRLAAGGLTNPAIYNRVASGLNATQLVTDFGRTKNLTASADLHAQASDQTTLDTRAQILVAVDRGYFALLRANGILKVAQETVSTRQLVVDQVTALASSNLRSTLDVSFANVNLGQAKLLLSSAQNDVHSAEADLSAALGLPGQTSGFTLDETPLPDPLADQPEPLVEEAIRERPDLASLRLQHGAADRFATAERDLSLPTVSLAGSAGFVPAGDAQVPGRFGAIGLNVNIPILNGGLFRARRTEAELRAQSASQALLDLQNRVTRDVRVAWLAARTAFDRLNLTAQVLDQARLALDLSQQRYNLGLGSIIELTQAQLNVTTAEIDSTAAKYDYQAQRSVLAFTIGALR